MCTCTPLYSRQGQRTIWGSRFSHSAMCITGLDSGCPAWWQMSLLTEPSCPWVRCFLFSCSFSWNISSHSHVLGPGGPAWQPCPCSHSPPHMLLFLLPGVAVGLRMVFKLARLLLAEEKWSLNSAEGVHSCPPCQACWQTRQWYHGFPQGQQNGLLARPGSAHSCSSDTTVAQVRCVLLVLRYAEASVEYCVQLTMCRKTQAQSLETAQHWPAESECGTWEEGGPWHGLLRLPMSSVTKAVRGL